ncbi:class I glutamine amidotransferase-like protein [Wolfiporia cocos MD-104 SS10]|uniref:Class I glutamine amidotransferase-like protein n=1 Tax=Wolfiporia cocos (strain MD-104) TaxID=742152 RepID=A0A2H3JJK0_WOLCO|nr:class I glutamine amidotransferase-like protein [Wolfiporia cocos MD-104 SS10]
MSGQKRIALLLCDTPIPDVVSTDGDYTAIFSTLLRNALPKGADVDFTVDPYDVRNKLEYPASIDDYDALMLTGSAASAYENLEWINRLVEYVREVALTKPQVKIFGICFGHQIVARALGGECVPNGRNWEVGVTEVSLTPLGQQLLGVPAINIQQMHRDHVPATPPSFHLLGSTSIAPNQGMVRFRDAASEGPESSASSSTSAKRAQDVHIFTVQGHPEFTTRIVDKIVRARESTGVLTAQIAEDARRRANWRNDGVDVVGKFLWEALGVIA